MTTPKAFYALTLFTLLATPINSLVECATGLASAVGSFERINAYLIEASHSSGQSPKDFPAKDNTPLATEKSLKMQDDVSEISNNPTSKGEFVVARNINAGWEKDSPPVLKDMNFELKTSNLTIIVGPVGCGKSTLLNVLLGETTEFDGQLKVFAPEIAYCSQTPWLTNSTLQQNVLGESILDIDWYNTVIHACALEQDIELLPLGDQTMLGSKGAALSGGQKQRLVSTSSLRRRMSRLGTITNQSIVSRQGSIFQEGCRSPRRRA